MPKTFLCSTGTSIAKGCPALAEYQARPSAWDEGTEELSEQIQARLAIMNLGNPAERIKVSAEVHALHRLNVSAEDEVVLFVTDSADGRCCAQELKKALESIFDVSRVVVERIAGLQVRDSELLRKEGLTNLTRKLITYLEDVQHTSSLITSLNTNGGFKGLVPFFTILGMLYRVPVVYIFEFAQQLITLPPLPIGFSEKLLERAMPALQWAREKGVFAPNAFLNQVAAYRDDERELFEGFLEQVDEVASLSPLAEVLIEREIEEAIPVKLSTEAWDAFNGLPEARKINVANQFVKLGSPTWRAGNIRRKHTSDLLFFGSGESPWRFAGYIEDGGFHVCWFSDDHRVYNRWIKEPDKQKDAYRNGIFERFDFQQRGFSDNSDYDLSKTWGELQQECSELNEMLDRQKKEHEEERQNYKSSMEHERGLQGRLRDEVRAKESEIEALHAKVSKLEKEAEERLAETVDPVRHLESCVEAVYQSRKGRTHHFRLLIEGVEYFACVPIEDVAIRLEAGERYELELKGYNECNFEAAMNLESDKNNFPNA